jgi:hypothetical protein
MRLWSARAVLVAPTSHAAWVGAIIADGKGVGNLTRMWRRDCGITVGKRATIDLWLEGPQQADLGEDFLRALKKAPKALAFFDDLAQFYRKCQPAKTWKQDSLIHLSSQDGWGLTPHRFSR